MYVKIKLDILAIHKKGCTLTYVSATALNLLLTYILVIMTTLCVFLTTQSFLAGAIYAALRKYSTKLYITADTATPTSLIRPVKAPFVIPFLLM